MIALYDQEVHRDGYVRLEGYSADDRSGDRTRYAARRDGRSAPTQQVLSPVQRPTPRPEPPPPTTIEIDYEKIVTLLLDKMALDGRFRGPAGPPGETGAAGPAGPPGRPGRDADLTQLPPIRLELYDTDGTKYDETEAYLGETVKLKLVPFE